MPSTARRALALTATLAVALGVLSAGGPVQATPAAVHFVAAGDFHATTSTSAVLTGMRGAGPELALALGDLSYGSSTDEQVWCDYVVARVGAGFPFELISGNHESSGTVDGDINDFSACLPNQLPGVVGTYGRQWYVDHPRQDPTVRFIMISPGLTFPDGTWSYASGTPRYQWTASAIDGARSAGIPWVVVGLHKPCLSVGTYGCDGQADINNLLVAKKVDLVLNGHEHLYQRSKQLGFSGSCQALVPGSHNAACVVDGDDDLVRGAGTVFATVGTGGVPLRDVNGSDTEAGYFRTWSGLNSSPSHGFLDVTADGDVLSARFVAATGAYSDAFTIRRSTEPVPNQPPVGQISAACSGTQCSFDASGSTDPDGVVVSYAWDLGDGGTATGSRVTHTYAAPGTYAVSLTVTDDDGAAHTTSSTVTATAAAVLASDSFSRTVSAGLGVADVGGAWSVTGSSSNASVSNGTGRLVVPTPGAGQVAGLPFTTSTARSDMSVTVAVDKTATGSGTYVSALARRVAGVGSYRAKLRLLSSGAVALALDRTSTSGAETTIVPLTTVPGLTYAPGVPLRLRVQALGTAPTQLRAKAWRAGTAEPTSWLLTATDATAGLQASGGVGAQTYVSGSATNAPVTVSLDDLAVVVAP